MRTNTKTYPLLSLSPSVEWPNLVAVGAQTSLFLSSFDLGDPSLALHPLSSSVYCGEITALHWGGEGMGQVAVGMMDGSLSVCDGNSLLDGESTPTSLTSSIHTGELATVRLHPTKAGLLATGGRDGEIHLLDFGKGKLEEFKPGTWNRENRGSGIGVAWNDRVPHVLVTACGERVVLWDLKSKKEFLSFSDPGGKKGISSLSWTTDALGNFAHIALGFQNKGRGSVQIWDMRNHKSPLHELKLKRRIN